MVKYFNVFPHKKKSLLCIEDFYKKCKYNIIYKNTVKKIKLKIRASE